MLPKHVRYQTAPHSDTMFFHRLLPMCRYTAHLDFRERSARAAPQERFFLLTLAVFRITRLAAPFSRRKKNITGIFSTYAPQPVAPVITIIPVLDLSLCMPLAKEQCGCNPIMPDECTAPPNSVE